MKVRPLFWKFTTQWKCNVFVKNIPIFDGETKWLYKRLLYIELWAKKFNLKWVKSKIL